MSLAKKDISVIIPCYNTQPEYLQDAVNSVFAYTGNYSYEIIIMDDGSTNQDTIGVLENFNKEEKIKVFYQLHKGPSAARNNAVTKCNSDYILCLDSDNKIRPNYIDAGIEALSVNPESGVAYGKPYFIGDINRTFITGKFDIEKLLTENYIDMCAVIRRKAWEEVGGLDENLIYHEDWEFWIHLFKAGWQFIFLNKILFDYRVRADSLMSQKEPDHFKHAIAYLYKKHHDVVFEAYQKLYGAKIIYKNDMQRPLRSFIKYSKKKFIN